MLRLAWLLWACLAAQLAPLCFADEAPADAAPEKIPFTLRVHFKVTGEWRVEVLPGIHPSFTRNEFDVQILSFDEQPGSATGEVDFLKYGSHCGLGAKLSGTFDGRVLHAKLVQCPDSPAVRRKVWKQAGNFRGVFGRRQLDF